MLLWKYIKHTIAGLQWYKIKTSISYSRNIFWEETNGKGQSLLGKMNENFQQCSYSRATPAQYGTSTCCLSSWYANTSLQDPQILMDTKADPHYLNFLKQASTKSFRGRQKLSIVEAADLVYCTQLLPVNSEKTMQMLSRSLTSRVSSGSGRDIVPAEQKHKNPHQNFWGPNWIGQRDIHIFIHMCLLVLYIKSSLAFLSFIPAKVQLWKWAGLGEKL